MHPCLRLSTLNILPYSTKRVALAAVKGSFQKLEDVRQKILAVEDPILLLPIVYILLDPTRIPTPDRLDASLEQLDTGSQDTTLADGTRDDIATTMLAWEILTRNLSDIPPEVALNVWRRLWTWFQFVDMYHDQISGLYELSDASVKQMLVDIVSFAEAFQHHPQSMDLIKATPGFYAIVGRLWISLLQHTKFPEDGLNTIMTVTTSPYDPGMFAQLSEGTGGSAADLASLVMQHCHYALRSVNTTVTRDAPLFAFAAFNALLGGGIEEAVATDRLAHHFLSELLRKDIIACLSHTILALCGTTNHINGDVIGRCFVILTRILSQRPTLGVVLDKALVGALPLVLRAVVRCGSLIHLRRTFPVLKVLLYTYLASSTVHLHTMAAMHHALDNVRDLASTVAFGNSDIFSIWKDFTSVVGWRFAVWDKGGHRASCPMNRSLALRSGCGLSSSERAYLRALVDAEYAADKFEIYRKVVLCLRMFPGAGYFVVFDYTNLAVKTTIHSLANADWGRHDALRRGGAEWEEYVARAAYSDGRLAIHVMCCQDGDGVKYWVTPLRSKTSTLHDGVMRIAASDGGFADDLEALLVEQESDFAESH
ncbi:hypothetical protein C8R46DRAFT_1212458 [Mycena filopes]|nr:hypothetical protein C8R46DRAFT_1212458 [Mycena filopes]